MEKEGNIKDWEKVLHNLPESYKKWFVAEDDFLRRVVVPGSRVLDVGCGEGRSLVSLKDKDCEVVGVDIDGDVIEKAKKRFAGYSNFNFFVGDARNLSLDDDLFDYVLCLTTPASFGDDKYKFYFEMKRVLKKGGEMIISVFNEDALADRLSSYRKNNVPIKEIRGTTVVFENFEGSNVSEQFSRKELEAIFDKVGLKVLEIIKVKVGYICRLGKD